jgi:hypothetical protein
MLVIALLLALGVSAVASGKGDTTTSRGPAGARSAVARTATFQDDTGDVAKPKLDIRSVRVVNKPGKLKVRVYFPGVAETYDFPLGAVSVFLDTDAAHRGPEYGHFMDFFSDYRFAETDGWREKPTAPWAHSPEGRCVATAGVQSDKKSKLRWFEYVVTKNRECFDADAVRVAVSTINEGDLQPTVRYRRPFYDHLVAKHAWTEWIPEA